MPFWVLVSFITLGSLAVYANWTKLNPPPFG
jgi:hypothetical protein